MSKQRNKLLAFKFQNLRPQNLLCDFSIGRKDHISQHSSSKNKYLLS